MRSTKFFVYAAFALMFAALLSVAALRSSGVCVSRMERLADDRLIDVAIRRAYEFHRGLIGMLDREKHPSAAYVVRYTSVSDLVEQNSDCCRLTLDARKGARITFLDSALGYRAYVAIRYRQYYDHVGRVENPYYFGHFRVTTCGQLALN